MWIEHQERSGCVIGVSRAHRAELTVSASGEHCGLHWIEKDGPHTQSLHLLLRQSTHAGSVCSAELLDVTPRVRLFLLGSLAAAAP
jgi:hypothetical protein